MYGIDGSRDLSEFLTKHGNRRVLSKREVAKLVPLAQAGDKRATRKMVEHNIRLVVSIVGKYAARRKHYHMRADDVFQEGCAGLMTAIQKFEPERGHAFSTYATWWIHQRIRRAYDDQDLSIRHPVHVKEAVRQFYKIDEEVRANAAGELSIEEVWDEVKKRRPQTSDEVFRVIKSGIIRNPASLDQELGAFGNNGSSPYHKASVLGDMIADEESAIEASIDGIAYGQEVLEECLKALPERQERIVRLRYGFMHDDDYHRTYDEVGRIEGLTRERIRQILLSATVALRREYRRRGYEISSSLPDAVAKAQRKAKAS
jgi:RNA polymerase primary sigma factor